jgi:hypothetical protein
MKVVFLGSVLIACSGCTKDPSDDSKEWDQYVARYADAYCELRAVCDLNFEDEFGDADQCKKEVLTNENKGRERRKEAGCEFDPEEGNFCVSATAEILCESWLAGGLEDKCSSVWSCD